MPEYRRFISYFYEYIDGKKQRNAGFAKVELRNGMWRILYRLTTAVRPRDPVEVFGFLRIGQRLVGLPLGVMRTGREMTEERAYRAGEPVWLGKYGLSDLSGIWIRSGDGRCFVTIWDDEPVDPSRFETGAEAPLTEDAGQPVGTAAEAEETKAGIRAGEPLAEDAGQPVGAAAEAEETEVGTGAEEPLAEDAGQPVGTEAEAKAEETEAEVEKTEVWGRAEAALAEDAGQPVGTEAEAKAGETEAEAEETEAWAGAEAPLAEGAGQPVGEWPADARMEEPLREIYEKREPFHPFAKPGIEACIRVAPCDIARLQAAHWRTGRNNFLLHGFHQYRHLMIGRKGDGRYVLGVPGVLNPQEKYLAEMFGFPEFYYADRLKGNPDFGYWCRILEKEGSPQQR